jgi:23S rRNA (pseudouridine1915-N3)-methyltransferase
MRLNIQIVAVGKIKESYLTAGIAEYMKRLTPYAKVKIVEVPDERAAENLSAAEEEKVRQAEGARLLSCLKPDTYVIALAIDGKLVTSEEIASQLERLGVQGKSQVAFVIGGSLGMADEVLNRVDLRISFGRVTYPHQLMRLILVEQVYRAFKIMRGEPYHK